MNIFFADDGIVRIILMLTEAAWSYKTPPRPSPQREGKQRRERRGEGGGEEREERRRRPIRQSWRMQRAGVERRGGKERTILSS